MVAGISNFGLQSCGELGADLHRCRFAAAGASNFGLQLVVRLDPICIGLRACRHRASARITSRKQHGEVVDSLTKSQQVGDSEECGIDKEMREVLEYETYIVLPVA